MVCRSPQAVLLLLFAVACRSDNAVPATGTIEATEAGIGAEVTGRLIALRVQEGDRVNAGDTLAILSTATLASDINRQEAGVAEAEAQLSDTRAGARSQEVARAAAELDRSEAELALAESTRRRIEPLVTRGDVPAQQGDEARAAVMQAGARVAAARAALSLLQVGPRAGAVASASARVRQAVASLDAVQARRGDLALVAPMAGRVRATWYERGEIVPVGRPVLTLADESHPWVRVYVGQETFARIAAGTPVTATLDIAGPAIAGRVVALADRAEFTPRVALTEDERADLMFWVKIALTDSTRRAKAGLPITVRFDTAAAAKP